MKKNTPMAMLLLLSILVTCNVFASKNYLKGSVIDNNNQKIEGYIDYKNWSRNPNQITFKADLKSEETILTTSDIKEFIVAGEIYRGANVTINMNSISIYRLSTDQTQIIKTISTFLRLLIDGDKSLYYLKNENDKEFFFIQVKGKYMTLEYGKTLKDAGGIDHKRVVVENKKYLGQLSVYLADCPSISSHIAKSKYNINSLQKVFKTYYACTDQNSAYVKAQENTTLKYGLVSGLALSTLSFSQNGIYSEFSSFKPGLNIAEFPTSISPIIGFSLEITPPRRQGTLSYYNELMLVSNSFKTTNTKYSNEQNYTIYDFNFKLTQLYLNSMIRKYFSSEKITGFINVGLSLKYTVSYTSDARSETEFYGLNTIRTGDAVTNQNNINLTTIVGGGIKYNQFLFEIRTDIGFKTKVYYQSNSKENTLLFVLGYQF